MTEEQARAKLSELFVMGQNYWYYSDHEFYSYGKKADAIKAKADALIDELSAALQEDKQ